MSDKKLGGLVVLLVLLGVFLMPGRATVVIDFSLDDVAYVVGTAVILFGVGWAVYSFEVKKKDDR